MRRRTRFQVRILINERLPVNNYKQTFSVIDITFTSSKYHCDCPGLQRQIKSEFWDPYCDRYFTEGRYLSGINAVIMGVDQDRRKTKLSKRGAIDGHDS